MWERERETKRNKFSKTTAKGLVILIFLILTIQILYFIWGEFFRGNKIDEETWYVELDSTGTDIGLTDGGVSNVVFGTSGRNPADKGGNRRQPERRAPEYFAFDPNTATKEEFIALGLSPRQAQVVLNYREKGGDFHKPADFSKIYVISDSLYRLLEPYITIEQQAEQPSEKEEKNPPLDNRIELNTADSLQLLTLYGIGPYYASKILQYRARLGSFHSIEQLLEIKGIDPERFEGFHKYIRIDSTTILPLDLYKMSPEELSAHPYIGSYAARGIIRLREITPKEEFRSEMLFKNRILTEERYNKLSRYLKIIPNGTEE